MIYLCILVLFSHMLFGMGPIKKIKPIPSLRELSLQEIIKKSPDEIISAIKKAPTDLYPDWISMVIKHPFITYADKRKIIDAVQPEIDLILTNKKMKAKEQIDAAKKYLPINFSVILYIFLHPKISITKKEALLKYIKNHQVYKKNEQAQSIINFFKTILERDWKQLTPKKLSSEGINLNIGVNSLLYTAYLKDNLDAFGFLLAYGAKLSQTEQEDSILQSKLHMLLMQSIEHGDLLRVRLLIRNSAAKYTQKLWLIETIALEDMPLYWALVNGKMDVLRYLLQQNLYDLKKEIKFKGDEEKQTLVNKLKKYSKYLSDLIDRTSEKNITRVPVTNIKKGIKIIKQFMNKENKQVT